MYNNLKSIFLLRKHNKNVKIIFFLLLVLIYISIHLDLKIKKIKIALCTMAKNENLYAKEFINYYIKLGIDQIYIYDDSDEKLNIEKNSDIMIFQYKKYLTIYNNIKNEIHNQSEAFTDCYNKHNKQYDWILMIDMDEYLYIVNNTLKNYLSSPIFDKCDFIKFHWLLPTDNGLLHYDSRPLFERFKEPYIKSKFIKSIVRGNISNLQYSIHSPYKSPKRNITCDNEGKKINYIYLYFNSINEINIEKAYIIHFCYKSTEEYINKLKRGYSNWSFEKDFYRNKILDYFRDNKMTKDKIKLFEKELNINYSEYKK